MATMCIHSSGHGTNSVDIQASRRCLALAVMIASAGPATPGRRVPWATSATPRVLIRASTACSCPASFGLIVYVRSVTRTHIHTWVHVFLYDRSVMAMLHL